MGIYGRNSFPNHDETPQPPDDATIRRRKERARLFGEMGFGEVDAGLLAGALFGGFLVHVGYVQRMLDGGATHEQVCAIIL